VGSCERSPRGHGVRFSRAVISNLFLGYAAKQTSLCGKLRVVVSRDDFEAMAVSFVGEEESVPIGG